MTRLISPWSVKGIDNETRDIARQSAKNDQITIGAWINKAILNHRSAKKGSAKKDVSKTQTINPDRPVPTASNDFFSERLDQVDKRLDDELRPIMFALNNLALRLVAAETLQKQEPPRATVKAPFEREPKYEIIESNEQEVKIHESKLDNIKADDCVSVVDRPIPTAPIGDLEEEIVLGQKPLQDPHSSKSEENSSSDFKQSEGTTNKFNFFRKLTIIILGLIFVGGLGGSYLFPEKYQKIVNNISIKSNGHLEAVSRTVEDSLDYVQEYFSMIMLKSIGLVEDVGVGNQDRSTFNKNNGPKQKTKKKSQLESSSILNEEETNYENVIGVSGKQILNSQEKKRKLPQVVSQSEERVTYSLKRRANDGEAPAQYQLAINWIKKGALQENYSNAANWLKVAAVQGLTEAQYALGLLYNEGAGVAKDRTQAFLWFHAAAKEGHPVAQFNLACLYLLDEGRVKNYTKALYWFEASSNNGVDKAAHNFSILSKVIKVPKLEKSEIPKLYDIDSVDQLSQVINDLSVKKYNQTKHELVLSHNNKLLDKKEEKLNKLVFNIQKQLKLDGFYVGSLDGLLGPNTESAIRVYQLEHGFNVSGIPSIDLLKRMEKTSSR